MALFDSTITPDSSVPAPADSSSQPATTFDTSSMPSDNFDSSLNLDYHNKYDTQSNIVSDLLGGSVAAVADFGSSVWNSLPGTTEADTADLLKGVSDNALRVYEEHPDAVHAASFIGGMFVPAGFAMKGLGLARAGVKGVNWFSAAGKAENLAKIDTLFREGAAATTEYRAAKNALYAQGLANQVLDAAAMELAVVGTMNAHPMMEDYMKDPVKNFAISAAFGGVLGGAIGHIADRFEIARVAGGAESDAVSSVLGSLKAAPEGANNATQLQIHQANVDSYQAMLAKGVSAGKTPENDLSMQLAGKILSGIQGDQVKLFDSMLSPELTALAKENNDFKQALMQKFSSTEGMAGVDNVALFTQKLDKEASVFKFIGKEDTTLTPNVNFATKTYPDGTKQLLDAAYYPEFDRFASLGDARHYARARDTGLSIDTMDKMLGQNFGIVPNTSAYEGLFSKTSANADLEYLAALNRVDKMDVAEIKKLVIAPDDLPMMNALVARSAKEPGLLDGVSLLVTKNKPNFQAMEQAVYKEAGVAADHNAQLLKFTDAAHISQYDLLAHDSSIGPAATELLDGWRGGSGEKIRELRQSADSFFRGGYGGKGGAGTIEDIYHSAQSTALRAKFAAQADAEGNVYLYRGMRGKAAGHSPIESYTTQYDKAAEFGTPKLYKVHVDDILGAIVDPGHSSLMANEILVGAPARQTVASIPVSSATPGMAQKFNTVRENLSIADINNSLLAHKESMINSLGEQGVPFEAIAIRTNTPVDTVKSFFAGAEHSSILEAGIPYEYRRAADIGMYLDPSKRVLRIGSDINKKPWGEIKAGLDIKDMADMSHEITSSFLAGSASQTAKDVGAYLFEGDGKMLGMLREQIGNFVNSKAGSKFFQSTDFYVRNMGDVGTIASTMGKRIQHISNVAINRVLKPITQDMALISRDPQALIEANVATQVNASLEGWRIFKDGQFWQKIKSMTVEGKEVETLVPVQFQGKEFKVVNDSVKSLFDKMQSAGGELYSLKNTVHKILGKKDMNDIGFWMPSFNPKGKFISYAHDSLTDETKLLWGNTASSLADAEKAYLAANASNKNIRVVTKGYQDDWNLLSGRMDSLTMDVANVTMQKTGSAAGGIIKANADIFAEIAGGYEHYISSQVKQLAELSMHDIVDGLDRMSRFNQRFHAGQNLNAVSKLTDTAEDTANVIKNTLLGNSNLTSYQGWRGANQSFETALSMGMRAFSTIWDNTVSPLTKGFMSLRKKELSPEMMKKVDYETMAKQLEARGIVNPYAAFDKEAANMFGLAQLTDHPDSSKRLIYASNALAATIALRFGELAQPLVNAMSLPILTGLAMANKMPETFMGVAKGSAKAKPVQIMFEGARAMHDPAFDLLRKKWEAFGDFTPLVSEANETLKLARGFDKGAITHVENALNSNLVSIMSKPADFSEGLVRRMTMHTGAVLAKRLYPELDDMGVTIFARDFMDKAVGNYHAAQRPVFFQGTMGVALGLFQTYMLTMAQNTYRHLELKNYQAIGKAMLAQTTIFGGGSLPGFHAISEAIGTHFSDNNVDLQTGTYRAIGDKAADFLLYGMPSNMGPAFYTRGEIAPRVATPFGGIQNTVGFNVASQMTDMITHVAKGMTADYPEVGRSLMEALSMQSMSRPLARTAELMSGYSVTRKGNTIAVPEDVWTPTGVISRILSTRPLAESKLREAIHLNTFYGSADHDARNELMTKLKTSLRNGTLDETKIQAYSEAYMRKGGTPTGWRSAYNTAIAQTNVNGKAGLVDKMHPENPINFMIDNLD